MTQQAFPQITTLSDLLHTVDSVLKITSDNAYRPLDEYLRALWGLIQDHQNDSVSYALLAELLTQAMTARPVPFDPDWLQYTTLPDRNEGKSDYEHLRKTILCQIADLYRMKDMEIGPLDRHGGIWLPTGNAWYNFQLADFLGQALMGCDAHNGLYQKGLTTVIGRDPQSTECDWVVVAEFLALGQMYE